MPLFPHQIQGQMKKPLNNTVAEINKLHAVFVEQLHKGFQTAVKIGELLVAERTKHEWGEWRAWMRDNLTFNYRTANDYMRCFANKDRIAESAAKMSVQITSIRDAIRLITQRPTRKSRKRGNEWRCTIRK